MSSFMRNLVVLSIFSMLAGFTVMTASTYIFIFRLSVPVRNVASASSIVRQTAIIESFGTTPTPTKSTESSVLDLSARNNSLYYYSAVNEFETDHYRNGTTAAAAAAGDRNQTSGSGTDFESNNNSSTIIEKHGEKPQKNLLNFEAISKSWVEFRKTWGNSKSYVLSTSAVAFVSSLFQFMTAALIIFFGRTKSNDKLLRHIAFRWIAINCVTAVILVTIVVSNRAMDSDPEKASGNPNYLSELEYNRETHVLYELFPLDATKTGDTGKLNSNGTNSSVNSSSFSPNNNNNGTTNNNVNNNSQENYYTINALVTKYIISNFFNTIISLDILTLFIIILSCSCLLRFYESPSYNNLFLVK